MSLQRNIERGNNIVMGEDNMLLKLRKCKEVYENIQELQERKIQIRKFFEEDKIYLKNGTSTVLTINSNQLKKIKLKMIEEIEKEQMELEEKAKNLLNE